MIVKIGNKKYIGQCNALSYIFHNRLFKKNIIEELNELRKCFIQLNKETTEDNTADIYNILIRVIYTLIYTHDSSVYSFNEFREDIQEETITIDTINEVVEILIKNFTDEEVFEELEKIGNGNTEKSKFSEHEFLIMCLRFKLTIQDLKILTYIDVIKMLIVQLDTTKEEGEYRQATQNDIDKLLM